MFSFPSPVEPYISTSISVTTLNMKTTNCLINIMTITQNRVHICYCTKWDTDLNKSTDFFQNPICIMHTTYYTPNGYIVPIKFGILVLPLTKNVIYGAT